MPAKNISLVPDNVEDKPPKACPKWSNHDNYRSSIESYCNRQGVKILQKRKISSDDEPANGKKVSDYLTCIPVNN